MKLHRKLLTKYRSLKRASSPRAARDHVHLEVIALRGEWNSYLSMAR